jgi:replicative DNA helicase
MNITTDSFELLLLSAAVKNTEIYNRVSGFVDGSTFSSALSVEVFDIVHAFFEDNKRVPNQQELLHLYKRDRIIENPQTVTQFVELIFTQEVDVEFVVKELQRYVRLRKLEGLFRSSYEKLKLGQNVEVSTVVSDMFRIETAALDSKHIYGVNIDEADYLLEQSSKRDPVPTNLKYLNEVLDGGLCAGQLGVILAPTSYGKTMTMLNFAIYAWMKGKNVLFVTLEMREFSILRRAIMILGGALKMDANMDTIRAVTTHAKGKFIILYRPVKTVTVDYLYSAYHQAMADGVKFDVVFLDYADLLMSQREYKEKRFELSNIFESLKSFAQVVEIPVWSATQANREGMRAETVKMEHMSEDISKAFISDVILSLGDKVQTNTTVKFFLAKHREGKSDMYIDTYVNEKLYFEDSTPAQASLNNIE